MKQCTIHPIPLCIYTFDKSGMTYLLNFGQPVCLVGYVWYIEGARDRILVDSGTEASTLAKAGLWASDIQTIESGLDKLGIGVSDIDLIIQTHLHPDHVGSASRLPKARVLVQKRELEFARNPHPVWKPLYHKELFDHLKFDVIDGDVKISEDVNVLLTPGHSPGSQSVSIETDKGTAVISGLCTINQNYEPLVTPHGETLAPVIIPGIHTDYTEAYNSLMKIKETANILLTIHDPAFLNRSVVP
jgi:N-acyl homoserine lactone hydrolase